MSLNESNDISQLKKFDIDLQFGKQWEVFVDDLFSGAKTCEVKTERDDGGPLARCCGLPCLHLVACRCIVAIDSELVNFDFPHPQVCAPGIVQEW